MSYRDEVQKEKVEKIEKESEWECGIHENTELNEEHEQECIGNMLKSYIINRDNYVVNKARITCDQMTAKPLNFKFGSDKTSMWIEEGKKYETRIIYPDRKEVDKIIPTDTDKIKKLYVVHGSQQTTNGIPFATVIERSCLRQEEEKAERKEKATGVQQEECEASIVSCGNCKILSSAAMKQIIDNWDKAKQYGTCYCFIRPDAKWVNPFCMESMVGECEGEEAKQLCTSTEHHHTMEFSTKEGKEEGLTMLSTLLCMRGGLITIEESGQNAISIDERYIRLLNRIEERTGRLEDFKLEFVKFIFPLLLVEEEKSGIPLEVMFAQMCCESEYGSKAVGNNYFGVKGKGTAGSVNANTQEEVDGVYVSIDDDFRAYNSMEESIEDYVNVLINNYQQYITTGTIEDWFDALEKGGYASASNYKEDLWNVCRYWRLLSE